MKCILSLLAMLVAGISVGSLVSGAPDPTNVEVDGFVKAGRLAEEGKLEEAFRHYAAVPGGEFAAMSLARGEAAKYLAVLLADPVLVASPRGKLLEAELLLASGRKEEAKERFRSLAGSAGKDNWGTGQPGYYPVEPPGSQDERIHSVGQAFSLPALPFTWGPGSHRDNWLLRRLIAMELTEEAALEFARMWEVHRLKVHPTPVRNPPQIPTGPQPVTPMPLARPRGFDSYGLQFALDYDYFLKRADRIDEALGVLLEPLRVMDMDLNPNLAHGQMTALDLSSGIGTIVSSSIPSHHAFRFGPGRVGTARKEFIRLAFGEFKAAGRESMLLDDLKKQIDRDENRARRVLAQMELHLGHNEEALALEIAYLENAKLDPLTTAYRRGQIFETYGKPAEAVTSFEKVLAAEPGPIHVPDADEQISGPSSFSSFSTFDNGLYFGHSGASTVARQEVSQHLMRLYAALGRTDKVLELQLSESEGNESGLENPEWIEQMALRFQAAGREAGFRDWALGKLATAKIPRARANLAWRLGDYQAAMIHAAEIGPGGYHGWIEWRARFAKIDRNHERDFMRAVVRARPEDILARLELLDLEDKLAGPEAMAVLEAMLANDSSRAFDVHKELDSRTRLKGYFDVAYRLMRLYEKHGRLDNLHALGLRLAKGEKPFNDFDNQGFESSGENGREEYGNACLALAIQHAGDSGQQAELAAALKNSRWMGARSQLARRTGKAPAAGSPAAAGLAPPWANLPPGVRVVVSCESVSCVARNERFVYVGLPWGLAVYDFNGAPVTRILLGTPVKNLVAADGQIWAGTDDGLFGITAGSWKVTHEPVGKVKALGLNGDQLWIGVGELRDNGLMVMNRHTLALRTFSAEEIGIERTLDFTRFESDGEYVWADNYFGLLRYDRANDSWSAIPNPGPNDPVHLIGIIDGEIWVDVWLNNEARHRPAKLDRKTLQVTPLSLRNKGPRNEIMINSRLVFRGHHHGQPVFGSEGGYGDDYVVEKDSNTIRRLRKADNSGESGELGAETISHPLPDGVRLPDGTSLRIPTHAWPDGLRAGHPSTRWSERWPSDAVWAVVFDDTRNQEWLCVGAGLAVMPRKGKTLSHFGIQEGLTAGPMLDGVQLNGKLYFASAWDDHRGCLTVHDPKSGVFTPWFRSDGMDRDKVVGLATKNGQLEVLYGVDYPDDDTKNQNPAGRFNPATGQFTSGGKQQVSTVEGNRPAPAANGTLPLLGGPAYRSYQHDGMTWFCGGHGLVIYPGKNAPKPKLSPMKVRRIPSPSQILREEATKTKIPDPIPVALFKELIKHPNPHVRARAVAAVHGQLLGGHGDEYAPMMLDCVDDVSRNVRGPAVWLLSQCKSPAAVPPLKAALDDVDPAIRAMATVALARQGVVMPLELFADIIKHGGRGSSYPYGLDSSIGVGANTDEVFSSLAPHANRKIFEFLVTLPAPNRHNMELAYPAFGESLRKHPDSGGALLGVQDTGRDDSWRVFVQSVFKHAGKEMLPVLHRALASTDRVVRSNAARACGAIGDASSIPFLIQSLEMESGLSRASIVWALGELKASDALPKLIGLHQDARNAESIRSTGSGFLAQNANFASQEQYAALGNLNAIASNREDFNVSERSRPRDPRLDEELLTPEHILEAVRKIGSADAIEFYHVLAAARNPKDRSEAAIGLAISGPATRAQSLVTLRNLVADSDTEVRVRACVSLLLLGEPEMDTLLRDRWRRGDSSERREILSQLARLVDTPFEPIGKELQAIPDH